MKQLQRQNRIDILGNGYMWNVISSGPLGSDVYKHCRTLKLYSWSWGSIKHKQGAKFITSSIIACDIFKCQVVEDKGGELGIKFSIKNEWWLRDIKTCVGLHTVRTFLSSIMNLLN